MEETSKKLFWQSGCFLMQILLFLMNQQEEIDVGAKREIYEIINELVAEKKVVNCCIIGHGGG